MITPLKQSKRPNWVYSHDHISKLLSQLHFELYNFNYYQGNSAWNNKNVILPCNAIYLILDGDGHFVDEHQQAKFVKGHAYLLPINVKHHTYCDSYIEKFWGCFSMELFPNLDIFECLEGILDLGMFPLDKRNNYIKRLNRWQPQDYLYIQGILYQLFGNINDYLEETINRQTYNINLYSKLFDFIRKNLNAKLMTSEIANAMNLSQAHLSRIFKRDIGITLKNFINNKLNKQACGLLINSNLKIKEIAHKLGYNDEYYFIRFFKKQNGIPPTKYRLQISNSGY